MSLVSFSVYYVIKLNYNDGATGETLPLFDKDGQNVGFVVSSRFRDLGAYVAATSPEYNYSPYQVSKSFHIKDNVFDGVIDAGVIGTLWTNVNDLDVLGNASYGQGFFQNKNVEFNRSILQPNDENTKLYGDGTVAKVVFTIIN
jgi:hypothetical protein